MNPVTAYRLSLTPLAPIHIGTGLSYEPTNYVIEGDTLHEFDTDLLADTLSAQDHQELLTIVSRTPDDTMLRLVQKFFYDRRKVLVPLARYRIPVQPGVASLYRDRVGQIAQQEGRGRRVINQLAISRTAHNPISRLPILPGSSVKGAIRTALLDQLNAGRAAREDKGLHPFQGKQTLFRYWVDGKPFFQLDPLRLIHLADAVWQGEPGLPATEIVFAVNKKKASSGGPSGQPRGARDESGPPQLLECLSPFRYRALAGQLNVQSLGAVQSPGKVPDEDLRFDLARIAQACNSFYRPILHNEINLLSQRGFLDADWGTALTEVLSSLLDEDGGAFLLRVGRHCGAESVTLNGVRKIKILQGRNRGAREESAATTVWLAAKERDQPSGLLPFGWLLVEVSPLDQAPGDHAALKTICEARLALARQWAQRLKTQEADWRRKGFIARASGPGTAPVSTVPRSPWVDQKLAELCSKPGIKPDDALRSSALAKAVQALDDGALRAQALADIVARWKAKGWWEGALGSSAKQAKAVYEELLKAST